MYKNGSISGFIACWGLGNRTSCILLVFLQQLNVSTKKNFSKASRNHTCFISSRFFPVLDNSYEDWCIAWSKTFILDIAMIKGDRGAMMCATLHLKLSLWCFHIQTNVDFLIKIQSFLNTKSLRSYSQRIWCNQSLNFWQTLSVVGYYLL